jgi:chromosome partitioning protein
VTGVSHYADLVREMRRHRRSVGGDLSDWVVVRNRISPSGSSPKPVLSDRLQELALEVGFRVATGFHERPIYRDLFPRGLTALDALCDLVPAIDPDPSFSIARREIHALLEVLKLPIDDRGRRRAAARAEWFDARTQPLDTGDILADLPL